MVNIRSTKKITRFVSEPLSGKPRSRWLCEKGYGCASALKKKAVAVKKGTFIAWLEAHVNANQLQAGWAYKSLCEHNQKFAHQIATIDQIAKIPTIPKRKIQVSRVTVSACMHIPTPRVGNRLLLRHNNVQASFGSVMSS